MLINTVCLPSANKKDVESESKRVHAMMYTRIRQHYLVPFSYLTLQNKYFFSEFCYHAILTRISLNLPVRDTDGFD